MDEAIICDGCGECETCRAMREAAAAGAQPEGVPVRVYGGYLEARAALRAGAPDAAVRILRWLLGHIADERGLTKGGEFPLQLRRLSEDGVVSTRVRDALYSTALAGDGAEAAWALMSIAEHAFHRLYLRRA